MRPLRIEAEGFTTFRERVVIDFDDADLFALVGPTGAGKSSVIDAMVFALYGKVPRYRDERSVAPVINMQSSQARVRLDFEVAGERYTVVRVVRQNAGKKTASHREARLEHGETVLAGDTGTLDTAIADLLGLTFEQFTKTVVLPQGEFARFLHETPKHRQDVLVQLLDLGIYNDIATKARERARSYGDRATIVEDELQRLQADTVDPEVFRTRAAGLRSLAEAVRGTLDERRACDDELAALRSEGERMRAEQRSLGAVAVPDDVRDLQRQVEDANESVTALAAEVAAAQAALDEATRVFDGAPDEVVAREVLRRWHDLAEREASDDAHNEALAQAAETLAAATVAQEHAATRHQAADAQLAIAKDRHRATALRHELHVGQPCPVCEQSVIALPTPIPARELDDANDAARVAAAARTSADKTLEDARRAHDRLRVETATHESAKAQLRKALAGAPTAESCAAQLALVASLRHAVGAGREALALVDRRARLASKAQSALVGRERELRRELTATRDALAALRPPAPSETDLLADWIALRDWAQAAAAARTELLDDMVRQHHEITARAAALRSTVLDACRAFDIDGDTPRLLEHVAEQAATADAAAVAAEGRAARATELASQITALRADQRVADDVAKLLGATGFQQWLLEEAFDDLVFSASGRLRVLSSGQFSLERDGKDFVVRDHINADDRRSVRTLSGGETFLASLALALALADSVVALSAAGAPRLESVFIDEGFGSLDAGTLDVVASAIEELGATGRMVGIVTHVRELAERLPVQFDVAKLVDTSTVTRVDR